ncbi:hypothetical protein BKA65DRAFT_542102 [Rhexocercosporidium sp. MPI-PUGE-AT-0058]|nr:hypothetical protein BKA65DRAFT_542102 [Rhexocercosporidium sp. MPI-PUGE-AT-0058]
MATWSIYVPTAPRPKSIATCRNPALSNPASSISSSVASLARQHSAWDDGGGTSLKFKAVGYRSMSKIICARCLWTDLLSKKSPDHPNSRSTASSKHSEKRPRPGYRGMAARRSRRVEKVSSRYRLDLHDLDQDATAEDPSSPGGVLSAACTHPVSTANPTDSTLSPKDSHESQPPLDIPDQPAPAVSTYRNASHDSSIRPPPIASSQGKYTPLSNEIGKLFPDRDAIPIMSGILQVSVKYHKKKVDF